MSNHQPKDRLRKAGQILRIGAKKGFRAARKADDAYSTKIREMYQGTPVPIAILGNMIGGGHPSLRKGEMLDKPKNKRQEAMKTGIEYALPAINAVPKYVAPAAGVTLAGKGLMDIANSFGNKADQPEENTLPMG